MKRIESSDLKQIKFVMENTLYELRWLTKCLELNSVDVDYKDDDDTEKEDKWPHHMHAGKFGVRPHPGAFKRQYGVTLEQMDEWIEWLE